MGLIHQILKDVHVDALGISLLTPREDIKHMTYIKVVFPMFKIQPAISHQTLQQISDYAEEVR